MRISDWSSDVCSSDLHGKEENDRDFEIHGALASRGQGAAQSRSAGFPASFAFATRAFSAASSSSMADSVASSEISWASDLPRPRSKASTSPSAASSLFSTRSEEHTSELQSLMRLSYAVFCLKKKKDNKSINMTIL